MGKPSKTRNDLVFQRISSSLSKDDNFFGEANLTIQFVERYMDVQLQFPHVNASGNASVDRSCGTAPFFTDNCSKRKKERLFKAVLWSCCIQCDFLIIEKAH